MKLFAKILVVPALAFPLARGQDSANINLLLGPSTLTAYAPDSALYDGLKVQYDGNLKVWQTKTWGYCPGPPKVPECPNGTDTVFSEDLGLYPVSKEGSQKFYVTKDGTIKITDIRFPYLPEDAYPAYIGWTWTELQGRTKYPPKDCPGHDPLYNCEKRTGYLTFKVPDGPSGYEGGLAVCIDEDDANNYKVIAVTPNSTLDRCVMPLKGLATHKYDGPMPPVWAYR